MVHTSLYMFLVPFFSFNDFQDEMETDEQSLPLPDRLLQVWGMDPQIAVQL